MLLDMQYQGHFAGMTLLGVLGGSCHKTDILVTLHSALLLRDVKNISYEVIGKVQ